MVDLILSSLSNLIAEGFEAVTAILMPVLGFDFQTFANAFPFAKESYYIFQKIAMGFAFLIAAFHIFKFLLYCLGVNIGGEKSDPLQELMQCALAVFMIYYGNHFLELIMSIAQVPFDALMYTEAAQWSITDFAINPLTAAIHDVFAGVSILAYIVMLLMICWSFIQVVIEAIERYLMVYLLIYTSPLASSTLASSATKGIFWKFFAMFMSQCLLMLLNVWTIKMAISLFSSVGNNASPMLALMLGYGFLRLAKRFDSYLNQLGLNAAVTGVGLANEIIATGAVLSGSASRMLGGKGFAPSGSSDGNAGGIAGFARKAAQPFHKFNPATIAGDFAAQTAKGIGSSVKNAYGAGVSAYKSSDSKSLRSAINAGVDSLKENAPETFAQNYASLDNVITRSANAATEKEAFDNSATRTNFKSGGFKIKKRSGAGMTDQQRTLISNNGHSADKVFSVFSGDKNAQTKHIHDVASVMKGLGGNNIPAIQPFIDSASDLGTNSPDGYTNQSFSLDQKGITAKYVQDGKTHTLHMKNQAQFDALPEKNRAGYKKMVAPTNDTFSPANYYYRVGVKDVATVTPKTVGSNSTPPNAGESKSQPAPPKTNNNANSGGYGRSKKPLPPGVRPKNN